MRDLVLCSQLFLQEDFRNVDAVGLTNANLYFAVNFVVLVPKDIQEQNISSWVDSEKFSAYIQISRTNFHDITDTGKSKKLKNTVNEPFT